MTDYRWHDLRKNPEDLPKRNRHALLAVDAKNKYWLVIACIFINSVKAGNWDDFVAWKEIEPFEG